MELEQMIGLGVAGNFAGHLEQAGEDKDFVKVEVKESTQPKGIFPFYVPSSESGFLSTFPLSHNVIQSPEMGGNLQIEPEVALICRVSYSDNVVQELVPLRFGAYNDCSIRRPNAKKISEKKNWGSQTKGFSQNWFEVDKFEAGGHMDQFRIACYQKRGEVLTAYGIDSPVVEYSYFHKKLLDWIVDRMNHQADQGPLESIAQHLKNANYPEYALISVGATRYTPFGESTFLQKGDQSFVIVYNGNAFSPEDIPTLIEEGRFPESSVSALIQDVL